MSNIDNSTDFDNSPDVEDVEENVSFKDASTSIEDLPCRITSIVIGSAVTILSTTVGRNTNSNDLTRHNNTPEQEDSDSSGANSNAKSLRVMKFGRKYRQLHLDLSDFGDSDETETSLSTSSTYKSTTARLYRKHMKEANKSLMNRISRKPRCKTNIFKALKSFEKNNLCTSNSRRIKNQDSTSRYDLDEVDQSIQSPIDQKVNQSTKSINQKVNQSTKSSINQKVNQLPEQKYIKHAFTNTDPQNFGSEKKIKTTIDVAFKSSKILDESKTTTLIGGTTFTDIGKLNFAVPEKVLPIHSVLPMINRSSLDWGSTRGTCSSASLVPILTTKNVNAQDKFKLKVRKATTKMEYLSRNCRFLHLSEPEMNKPLLILDFDSLLIPLSLPPEDLSKYKLEISRLIHTMYSHFNIAIWSATSMKILTSKLKYLDVFNEDKVTKIVFCLDRTSTITAFVPALGNTIVKSPEIIWNLYPMFNKKNTIMLNEDLKKFVFKQYGIPVGTQKDQKLIKHFELVTISNFLTNLISSTRSFSNLKIQSWKKPWN